METQTMTKRSPILEQGFSHYFRDFLDRVQALAADLAE